ncbi:MAG: hypothetical protein ABIQ60_15570 [Burkholderiaceae bacterium]
MGKHIQETLQKARDTKGMEASAIVLIDDNLANAKEAMQGLPPEQFAGVEAAFGEMKANVGQIIDAVLANATGADATKLDKAVKQRGKSGK